MKLILKFVYRLFVSLFSAIFSLLRTLFLYLYKKYQQRKLRQRQEAWRVEWMRRFKLEEKRLNPKFLYKYEEAGFKKYQLVMPTAKSENSPDLVYAPKFQQH